MEERLKLSDDALAFSQKSSNNYKKKYSCAVDSLRLSKERYEATMTSFTIMQAENRRLQDDINYLKEINQSRQVEIIQLKGQNEKLHNTQIVIQDIKKFMEAQGKGITSKLDVIEGRITSKLSRVESVLEERRSVCAHVSEDMEYDHCELGDKSKRV